MKEIKNLKKIQCSDCQNYYSEKNIYLYDVYGLKKVKICEKCLKEELFYIYDNIKNVKHLEYNEEKKLLKVKFKNGFKYLDTEEHIIK